MRMLRIDRCCAVALIAASLGLSGCCDLNFRGDGFRDDQSTNMRQYRKPDNDIRFFGFTNKARDIESNLGAQ